MRELLNVVYAFAIEGLDPDKVEEMDAILAAGDSSEVTMKAKARRERAALGGP